MTERRRLFVYGTLLRGEANAHLLAGAALLGPAVTAPGFFLVDLGEYPALQAGGGGAVRGELYEIDAAALPALDEFEGHPALYRRSVIRLADGGEAEAYLLAPGTPPAGPLIPSGDWRTRR